MPNFSGESGASGPPGAVEDTACSADTSPRRRKQKQYGFWKRFAYQKLRGRSPILGARSAQLFFLAAGTLLLALGIPILVAALGVKEFSTRYDNAGPMAGLTSDQAQAALLAAPDTGIVYPVDILVQDKMVPPIYVVYELGSFRQNYRRYVRSYDPKQMHDGGNTPGVSACAPFQYEGTAANSTLPEQGAVIPCGQIAHSLFNDTFSFSLDGATLAVDDSNIAWSTDANYLYGDVAALNYNQQPQYRGGGTIQQPLDQAQHWMVWMRPGGRVPVQKLYGQIDVPLPAGTRVTLTVANRYNTYGFEGSKSIILTTNSWVGGRNLFLPILYLVVAALCYGLALLFFLGYDSGLVWKRRPGDEEQLSWVRQSRQQRGVARVRAE